MLVLLENSSFLQELFLLLLWHGELARFYCHSQAVVLQPGLEHITEVTPSDLLDQFDIIVIEFPLFSRDRVFQDRAGPGGDRGT